MDWATIGDVSVKVTVDDLGLEPGVLAVAAVKATNVVIERPR